MAIWKLVILVVGSLGLLYISRQSLLRPRSHGFYRFFTWELILLLFLLNVSYWIEAPFAWYQVISWILLFTSLVPLLLGIRALANLGKPNANTRSEPALMAFERTTNLVSDGIYHYIRHPLYSSLLVLCWGIFFKRPSWPGLALALAASLFLFATARADEAECIGTFGPPYRQYMQRTHMFIPYIF